MRRLMLFAGVWAVCHLPAASGQWIGRPEPDWEKKLQVWVADVHKHVYPNGFGRDLANRQVEVQACRNEHVLIQLGARSPEAARKFAVRASALSGPNGRIDASAIRVRYAGLIPADENAQYTPDPLWEVPSVSLQPYQSQGIWLDWKVPAAVEPGKYEGVLAVLLDDLKVDEFRIALEVLPATLPEPSGFHCYLNIFIDPSSVARFKKLPLWGGEHWRQLEAYVKNAAEHGQRTITTFIVDDPWSMVTGFPVRGMIEWKHPGEWKSGDAGRFSFDFTPFDRFVSMCLKAGIDDHIEAWSPLVQPGSNHSMVTYTDTSSGQPRKVKLPAGSAEYKAVWGRFAAEFQRHLREKGWLDRTYLGFDEIHSDVLDKVVPFFGEAAPELKLMISGGDEQNRHMIHSREMAFYYGYYGPGSPVESPNVVERRKTGKRTLLYTAVNPLYPNTFIFSAPHESRYLGWIIWKWNFDGYIRWAWNFWPATLWDQPLFTWPSGDMFFVYPGKDGPVDSIRWEMLRKGLEDYECLWLAREGLEKLRTAGQHPQFVQKGTKDLVRAVDLATRQFDRTRSPREPVAERIHEARKIVNNLLVESSRLLNPAGL